MNKVIERLLVIATLVFLGTSSWAAQDDMLESQSVVAQRTAMHKLHAAVRSGNAAAIEEALVADLDINETAALELAILSEQEEIIDLLIARGADVNRPGLGGDLPMTVATRRGRQDLMQRLIDRGADINQRDRRGMTALDHAQRQGRPAAAEFLRHRGARDRTEPR